MRNRRLFLLLIIGAASLLNCSSGNNGTGLGGTIGTPAPEEAPTTITKSADGAAAAALVLQSKELVVTSTTVFRNLGLITQAQMVSAATTSGSGSCSDYGTYDYNSIYSNTSGNYNVVIVFSLCRENGFQYDGNYSAYGKSFQFTGRLGGLKIMNFKNNYTTLIGSLVGISLSFKMEGAGDSANAMYTILANGSMQAFDYYSLGQHSMTFSNLKTNYTITTDTVASTQSSSITANGKYSVKHSPSITTIIYEDFTVNTQKQLATAVEDVDMNGRVIIDSTKNNWLNGIFDVTTTVPVRTVTAPYPAKTTQGAFTINSAAAVQYGATNTVEVTVAGDVPANYAKEFMLMKQCDYYAMEQQLPIVSGPTGTASGTIMSISALSSGPASSDLDCYTDVHVSYFNKTSPAPGDSLLWYVHWASGLTTCTPQTNIPFQEATSSTGVNGDPCDVGLDINGSSTDVTSGGVEHFLAASLPAGYYILSIDNYSCSTAVGNDATVMIGDYLFGPYNCVYSTSDGDGSNPGAWCRLADVRVNTDGTIQVLTPDVLLNPWHP